MTGMTRGSCYAHLGFPAPDQPLFDALVAGTDPLDHIAFAADQGFGGVLDPFTAMRDPATQLRIGVAAARRGLGMGCFLYVPLDQIVRARWGTNDPMVRDSVIADVHAAIAIARRIGARNIAVITLAEPDRTRDDQVAAMADLLRTAGDLVGAAAMRLCVEGVNPARFPQALLHGIAASAAVVSRAAHPAVRLCFDTGHAAACGEDLAAMLVQHRDLIAVIQLADVPGRVEMGGGSIDLAAVLAAAATHPDLASLPFELEHRWSVPGAAFQRSYLESLTL